MQETAHSALKLFLVGSHTVSDLARTQQTYKLNLTIEDGTYALVTGMGVVFPGNGGVYLPHMHNLATSISSILILKQLFRSEHLSRPESSTMLPELGN